MLPLGTRRSWHEGHGCRRLSLILRAHYISDMAAVAVSDAARSLGVSQQRVRAMLADGRLEGKKLGDVWLVEVPDQRDPSLRPRRRPMSPAQAWRGLALLSGFEFDADPSVKGHLRARLRRVLADESLDDVARAGILRAWFRERAAAQRYFVPDVPLAQLRRDSRALPSGASHPDSPVRDVSLFEAYIAAEELAAVIRNHSMIADAAGNVLLRSVSEPEGLIWIGKGTLPAACVAVDLAEHDDARSIAAAGRLVQELSL